MSDINQSIKTDFFVQVGRMMQQLDAQAARVAELEAENANLRYELNAALSGGTVSCPAADTDKLRELRARIYEMKEAAYTYGDNSKEAVCAALDGVLDEIDEVASTALQAPVREVPEGYKLVPIMPTPEMIASYDDYSMSTRAIWDSMLAAAPLPSAPVQQEGEKP